MTQDEQDKHERNMFLYGVVVGILIMSQIAGILGSAGYEIPTKYTIARWSHE